MEKLYIVTGAGGHLGGTVVRLLSHMDCTVRGLVHHAGGLPKYVNAAYYTGDVTRPETLEPLFAGTEGMEVIVIHAAGLISIEEDVTPELYTVNVLGTKNILDACTAHNVKRLVYVSSVHAIPEAPDMGTITEVAGFSPDAVTGAYARTKAEATRAVIDSVSAGLDAVIVHPSGIIGPYDSGKNYLVQMIADYISGALPAGVNGGYDFVDVRDAAMGCILAAEKGRRGECYILSNRYCTVRDLFGYIRLVVKGHKKPCVPMWLAAGAAPLVAAYCRAARKRPLYTSYALHTLQSNGIFSHDKATRELGYMPRDLKSTVADTVKWLKAAVPQK